MFRKFCKHGNKAGVWTVRYTSLSPNSILSFGFSSTLASSESAFPLSKCRQNLHLALAGGPGQNESLTAWRARLQAELAEQKRAEQERTKQKRGEERVEQCQAEEHARLERQRVEELERQEMVRKAGDVGRWLHQDLGFDGNNSAVFGASLRACDLDNPKAIFAMDKQTLEGVLGKVEMPDLLTSLVMEAWRRRRKVYLCTKLCTCRMLCLFFPAAT